MLRREPRCTIFAVLEVKTEILDNTIQRKQRFSRVASFAPFVLLCFLLRATLASTSEIAAIDVSVQVNKLKDKNPAIRKAAARRLGEIGPEAKAAVPALVEALKDKDDESLREAALMSLIKINPNPKTVIPAFIEALKDTSRFVRYLAASALDRFGSEARAAVPNLIELLSNKKEDVEVRREAARTLGRIGSEAKPAVPALIEALKDADDSIRLYAAFSLDEIDLHASAAASLPVIVEVFKNAKYTPLVDEIAQELEKVATALGDAKTTNELDHLKAAKVALLANADPDIRQHAQGLERTIAYLELVQQEMWREKLFRLINEYSSFLLIIAAYSVFALVCLVLLWVRPLWLLRINQALEPYSDFKLPAWMGEMKVSLRQVIIVRFFHYHIRVLDAWVAQYIDEARDQFERKTLVKDRKVYVSIPVNLDGKSIAAISPDDLHPAFLKSRACVLIQAEGGAGKTSLACQLARWSMADEPARRLCEHFMLPVIIEQDLNLEVEHGKEIFQETIRGQLRDLTGEAAAAPEQLFFFLLKRKRILVIIDGLSELGASTRERICPADPKFSTNALVVTSRNEENLDGVVKITVRPMRIEGNRLSSFMEAYLNQRSKRNLFDDAEYFDLCGRLSLMVGERRITALLATLYAEHMILLKEGVVEGDLPRNIPDLMLSYLNKLNRSAKEGRLDDRDVHHIAKKVAWECLRHTYRPIPARYDDVLAVLGGGDSAVAHIKYLEERLRLIETVGAGRDRIRFALDPLAEYLAGLYLLEQRGEDEEAWRQFFRKADTMDGAPKAITGFLLATRDCCFAKSAETRIPGFVLAALAKRAGLDS